MVWECWAQKLLLCASPPIAKMCMVWEAHSFLCGLWSESWTAPTTNQTQIFSERITHLPHNLLHIHTTYKEISHYHCQPNLQCTCMRFSSVTEYNIIAECSRAYAHHLTLTIRWRPCLWCVPRHAGASNQSAAPGLVQGDIRSDVPVVNGTYWFRMPHVVAVQESVQ